MTHFRTRPAAAIFAAALLSTPVLAESIAPDATIASLVRGQTVSLSGIVDRITDEDEFLLRDDTGTVEVYVGPNRIPADPGEAVTVIGMVDDEGPMEIYATTLIRSDGTSIDFPHEY
jgi:hypothetical protein